MALLLFTYLGTQASLSQQMLKDPHLCWHGHTVLLNSEELDEVDPGVWHCPRKFSSWSAKSSRNGNVFMSVPELAKENVLIKMIFFFLFSMSSAIFVQSRDDAMWLTGLFTPLESPAHPHPCVPVKGADSNLG